jgi:hypothetical protein
VPPVCWGFPNQFSSEHPRVASARGKNPGPPTLAARPYLSLPIPSNFESTPTGTNTVQARHHIALDELKNPATLDILRAVFNTPEKLKPDKTREQVTEEAAKEMYPSPFTKCERTRPLGPIHK